MFVPLSQKVNPDGSIQVISQNFVNGIFAQRYQGATISGTLTVGPYTPDIPGAEAQVLIAVTVTPLS